MKTVNVCILCMILAHAQSAVSVESHFNDQAKSFKEQTVNINFQQKQIIEVILKSKPHKNLMVSGNLLEYHSTSQIIVIEKMEDCFLVQELSSKGVLVTETKVESATDIGVQITNYFNQYSVR